MRLTWMAKSPSTHPHMPFILNPESSRPLHLSCLLAWILDKWQISKRGLFAFSSYIRNLSLIHSTPFFKVLLCNYFITISLSLSLIIVHLASLHLFFRSLEQLCCYKCYPRYLGITRRSCLEAHMVLDMEYREQELPEHGPGGPFFSFSARFVLPAVPASITTGLGLYQRRLLLHEVIGPRYHGMCHI
jgi:hypothetical protein